MNALTSSAATYRPDYVSISFLELFLATDYFHNWYVQACSPVQ